MACAVMLVRAVSAWLIRMTSRRQVSYGAEIERVTVNGAEYEVQKTEGSSEYTVQLPAVNTPGVQAFHITKVSLNSGQEVEVDYCIVQCQKL